MTATKYWRAESRRKSGDLALHRKKPDFLRRAPVSWGTGSTSLRVKEGVVIGESHP